MLAEVKAGLNSVADTEWEEIDMIVDSGASDTVIGQDMIPSVPITESQKKGTQYECANGDRIYNLGQKKFVGVTEENAKRELTAQVTNVNKSLLSVSKVTSGGSRVVFDKSGSYIEDKTTGRRVHLTERNGMYMLKLWVKKDF